MKKKEAFLDLTRKMNQKFSIIPFLYGSLALQMLLDEKIRVSDIDINLPHDYENPSGRWPDTLAFMQSEGFEFDSHEYFTKDDIKINLSHNRNVWRSSFEDFVNLSMADIPLIIEDGAVYKRPTLEQHLHMYTLAADCRWRHCDDYREGYVNDNLERIPYILRALNRSEDYEYYRDKDFPIKLVKQHYKAPLGITYELAQPDTKYPEQYPKWGTADVGYKYCYDRGYKTGYANGQIDGKIAKHGSNPPYGPRESGAFRMNPNGITGRNDGYRHGEEDGYTDGYNDARMKERS